MSHYGIPRGFVFDDCRGWHARGDTQTAHAFGCGCAACVAATFGPFTRVLSADPSDITAPVDITAVESITC